MKRTPLKRRVGLTRRTPLSVTAGMVNNRSANARSKNTWKRNRAQALINSGGRCEALVSSNCTGWATEVHHRKMRSQGGSNRLENLAAVCGWCHRHIHHHPEESYQSWLLLRSWESEEEGVT